MHNREYEFSKKCWSEAFRFDYFDRPNGLACFFLNVSFSVDNIPYERYHAWMYILHSFINYYTIAPYGNSKRKEENEAYNNNNDNNNKI